MKAVAKFKKVSYEQFRKDILEHYPGMVDYEKDIRNIYEDIKPPKRATAGSAGYDFFLPVSILLNKNTERVVPTGIRCVIEPGWVLKLYPRSGLGFKYGVALKNTVGIIDSDYYNAENEGHIMVKLKADASIALVEGDAFCQGIFLEYGITVDDEADGERTGGFGSTDKG